MLRCTIIGVMIMLVLPAATEGGFEILTRYVDGTAFDPDTDILDVGESLYLSLYTDTAEVGSSSGYHWALICDSSLGDITGGVAGPDAIGGVYFDGSIETLWYVVDGSLWQDKNGICGTIAHNDPFAPGGGEVGPGLLVDEILYDPLSAGDVTIELYQLGWAAFYPYEPSVDSVIIHQVPEPMTIGLLALGALLLRRRRIDSK